MNTQEIKNECPKAYAELKKWMNVKFYGMAQAISSISGEQTPEIVITDEIIENWLQWSQRQLYTFFDEKEMFINVCRNLDGHFYYYINDEESEGYCKTRPEAEEEAFTGAFKQLENKL